MIKKIKKDPKDPLPNKPSELIAIALADLIKVEKSKKFRVAMGAWHWTPPGSNVCHVCLAGAVMACTLKSREIYEPSFNRTHSLTPTSFSFGSDGLRSQVGKLIEDKLYFLNLARGCYAFHREALEEIFGEHKGFGGGIWFILPNIPCVVDYENDKTAFKARLGCMIREFKKLDL